MKPTGSTSRRAFARAPNFRVTLLALAASAAAQAQTSNPDQQQAAGDSALSRAAGVVVITGSQPSSLPTRIPTVIEGITAEQIEATVNATDAEDAMKYFPSLLVRKRYIGDYNHAVLSTRASGTGNSARSLVYADGVLLSNLLGNGATFAPRWGLVTPEEIERLDVLYGPFSAAYPGNAVGAVVDYVTRMPKAFEAHAKVGFASQPYELYGQSDTFSAKQASASVGNRNGAFAWWINANRLDSDGQPLTFATKLVSAGVPAATGTPVTGATLDKNRANQPWYLIGAGTQYHTVQDHAKAKLAYDITPTLRASYTLGLWHNESDNEPYSFLRDANGQPVTNRSAGGITNAVNIDGLRYTLSATDFPRTRDQVEHVMHAAAIKSRTRGVFDWEVIVSVYDYHKDLQRAYAPTAAAQPEAGRLTDQHGTGWNTLLAKGVWRPFGEQGAHVFDFGVSQENYKLRTRVDTTDDWLSGSATTFASRFEGNARTMGLFVQDAWALSERWTTVLGLRAERWQAWDGVTESLYTGATDQANCSATTQRCTLTHPERRANYLSPKVALARQVDDALVLKASTGRAVRFPTVSELYQGGVNAQGQAINNNPDLRPEVSWTGELTAEWIVPGTSLRATYFHESTKDALYSQLNTATNTNTVQNVNRIRTNGIEVAANHEGGWLDRVTKGLSLMGSVTYADSRIVENDGFAITPGDTIGKWQPRVPRWRATAVATWRVDDKLTLTYGARYSGRQYTTLDNSDPNGFAYQGSSRYFTTDVRARYAFSKQWSAAFGIDNLNNDHYWNFHPYPQRTYSAELKYDLQ